MHIVDSDDSDDNNNFDIDVNNCNDVDNDNENDDDDDDYDYDDEDDDGDKAYQQHTRSLIADHYNSHHMRLDFDLIVALALAVVLVGVVDHYYSDQYQLVVEHMMYHNLLIVHRPS